MNHLIICLLGRATRLVLFVSLVLFVFTMSGLAENRTEPPAEDIPALIEQADRYFERIHEDMSGLAKAICLYEQILEKDPGHQAARWKLAEVLFISAIGRPHLLTYQLNNSGKA